VITPTQSSVIVVARVTRSASRGVPWAATTITEVTDAMANPTLTQRGVGQAIADIFEASYYDAEHWTVITVDGGMTAMRR
jgi:hypothetical protein